jgi:hypothetical protein
VSKPSASRRRTYGSCAVIAAVAVALLVFSPGHFSPVHPATLNSALSLPVTFASNTVPPGNRERLQAGYAALPLAFERNQGQVDPQVKYLARATGYTLLLTNDEAVFSFHSRAAAGEPTTRGRLHAAHSERSSNTKESSAVLRMQLVRSNSAAQIAAVNPLPGKTNYYLGNDPKKWQTNVSQYARVAYQNIYPGIDLAYYGEQSKLEFDFIVAPESDPAAIEVAFNGDQHIATDASGNLVVSSTAGNVVLHKPVAYQLQNGSRQPVEARFVLKGDHQVSFGLGSYDHRRELVIDPAVTYATYLGGTAEDDGYGIAFDSSGNAYVTGQTASTNFPDVGNTNKGGFDVFVTKIAANGSSLVYSTYVGGSGTDSGNAIAVDAAGDAFVAGGTSSTDFPTSGGFQKTPGGDLDAFVFELNPDGTALTYSSYLGGAGDDSAVGIALDSSGNAYVVGSTESTNFPTLNPIQKQLNGASNGFVTKLNSSGGALVYSTWLGGGTGDFASAVALDSSGNAYVTGGTQNTTFPTTTGAFQTTCGSCGGGLDDAFVTVINSAGSGYVYSTFLGGSSTDEGLGIAVDSSGDAYVTGLTMSTDFPTKSPLQPIYGGGTDDAFVTALNPRGTALIYSTYLGGSQSDVGTAIALDGGNHAYVTGQTGSSDFPTKIPTQAALKGGDDAFVSEINPAGSTFLFSTYLGGSLNEDTATAGVGAIGAIAVDGPGANIYVTGNTNSTDFPTVAAFQASNGGGIDAFVVKYAQAAFSIAATALNPASVSPGGPATSTVTVTAMNGFTGSVTLSCAIVSQPSNATSPPSCQFATSPLTGGSGVTLLTVSTTNTTTVGAYTIKVTGTGPSSFQSTNLSLAVAVPDFSIAGTAPATVSPGASGTSTITLTSIDGYASPVNLTCAVTGGGSPLPACSVTGTTPVTPVASPGATSTVTIATTGASAALVRPSKFFYGMWLPIVGLSLIGMGFSSARSRRKKMLGFLMVAMVMAGLLLMPGCGGSSSNGGGCTGCTPAGNYTVTITGTGTDASTTTHSTTVTLTVN